MSNDNFKLYSTRDLFDKAKRDYHTMKNSLSADTVFNFFATIYHVKDWIKFYFPHLRNDIETYCRNDMDFKLCEEICLTGKHIGTENRPLYENYYEINLDGINHPVLEIGKIILNKMDYCFEKYNI